MWRRLIQRVSVSSCERSRVRKEGDIWPSEPISSFFFFILDVHSCIYVPSALSRSSNRLHDCDTAHPFSASPDCNAPTHYIFHPSTSFPDIAKKSCPTQRGRSIARVTIEMAEVLGVITAIMQVAQFSEQVISACYQYYRTAKNAKKDIIEVINVVGGLKTTLDNLRIILDDNDGLNQSPPSYLKSLDGAIKSCGDAMKDMLTILGISVEKSIDPDELKVPFKKKLVWPWREKGVIKILEVLEKHKATFILALAGDTFQVSVSIKDSVDGVSKSIQTQKIINWLKLSDPSINHHAARDKHEPSTGDWFLESDSFVSWKEGSISSMWIHGIPGAGKTILCSSIIEDVQSLCHSGSADQCVYFYFDFNDPDKRTVVGMLRSMITQLCVHDGQCHAAVETLYNQCKQGAQQPGRASLVKTFLSLLSSPNRMYLIMDALDECSEREELFKVISEIVQTDANLLMTSRKEGDITDGLEGQAEILIGLEGCGIDGDISKHVQRCLATDRRLRKWSVDVRKEMEDALVKGAHGMYVNYE